MAQLRYRDDTRDWALYWRDRNERWREYAEGNRQFGLMDELLAEVDDDPTSIFRAEAVDGAGPAVTPGNSGETHGCRRPG